MSKFTDQLAQMRQNWEESQNKYDQMFGGVKIPADVYLSKLQSAKLRESRTSGNLMIAREHLIIQGDYKGMIVFDNMQLETPNGLVFVRRWIEMMGYQCPSADEFEAALEPTIEAIVNDEPFVKIRVTHDGDYTNVSVVEVVQPPSTQETAVATAPPPPLPPQAPVKGKAPQKARVVAASDFHNGVSVGDLVSVCELEGIDIGQLDKSNAKQIADKILQYGLDATVLEPTSLEILVKAGLTANIANLPTEAEPQKKDDALVEALRAFCIAQDIEFQMDDDAEILKERINAYTYPRDTLVEDEITLLQTIGQESNIVETQAPPPPPPAPLPTKVAPVKQSPAKVAPVKTASVQPTRRVPQRRVAS